jgi:hypothetical protein
LFQEIGREEIADCLLSGNSKISDTIANAARTYQEFLPEAATTSRRIALMFLTSNRANRICIYHHHVKTNKTQQDEEDARNKKFKITGMPYPRTVAKTKAGHDPGDQHPGQFHCGCPEEAVLWDFYFWKTMTATGEGGVVEGLTSAHRIEPRIRLFFTQRYTLDTTLTIDDIYSNGKKRAEVEERLVKTQIKRLKMRLKALGSDSESQGEQCSPTDISEKQMVWIGPSGGDKVHPFEDLD